MIVFALLLLCAIAEEKPKRLVEIITDYPSAIDGWITLHLDPATVGKQAAVITKIEWCKSTIPNPAAGDVDAPVPMDINGCKGYGLMHLTLYPSKRALIRAPIDEPNTLYIDPVNVGGLDARHQSNIVIHAAVDANTDLMQIVRFNPLTAAPTTSTSTTTTTTTTSSTSTSTMVPIQTVITPIVVSVSSKYNIKGMLVVFVMGMSVFALLGTMHYAKSSNWSLRKLKHYAKQRALMHGIISTYDQPMDFISGDDDNDDDDVVVVDDENVKEQNLQILQRLGVGASPAFVVNL